MDIKKPKKKAKATGQKGRSHKNSGKVQQNIQSQAPDTSAPYIDMDSYFEHPKKITEIIASDSSDKEAITVNFETQTEHSIGATQSPNQLVKVNEYKDRLGHVLAATVEFLVGLLMMPWIWLVGFYGIISLVILTASPEELRLINYDIPNSDISVQQLWMNAGFFLLINYSIVFANKHKYPRLEIILVTLTTLILSIVMMLLLPILTTVI